MNRSHGKTIIKAGRRHATPIVYPHETIVTAPALKLLIESKWVTHGEIYHVTKERVQMVIQKLRKDHNIICIRKGEGVPETKYSLQLTRRKELNLPIEVDICGEISTVKQPKKRIEKGEK